MARNRNEETEMKDPKYFPIERGLYEVGPGLKPLGTDLGQGVFDKKVFQIDSQFLKARENKILCWKENRQKYILRHEFSADDEAKVAKVVFEILRNEYPDKFIFDPLTRNLLCRQSLDQITLDAGFRLQGFKSPTEHLKPETLLEALLLQVQEDMAITLRTSPEVDYLAYLNLCSASHWSPADKIGKSFGKVHAPIPGNEKLVKASKNLVEAMIAKGPFVRFVWSFVTDTRLNHHPEAPRGEDPILWKGRSFDASAENPFFLRVERQVTWGLPQDQLSIFTIRISFLSGLEIKSNPAWREQLRLALQSMTPESRQYKGVAHCFDKLIGFLS